MKEPTVIITIKVADMKVPVKAYVITLLLPKSTHTANSLMYPASVDQIEYKSHNARLAAIKRLIKITRKTP
jgi:hypothetical protein